MHKDKIGSLLAHKLNHCARTFAVPSVRCSDGSYSQNPHKVLETFSNFYSSLYKNQGGEDPQLCTQYLQGVSLPKMSALHRSRMEAPFTAQEILEAIKSTRSGSAPRPDGFPAIIANIRIPWFRILSDTLMLFRMGPL